MEKYTPFEKLETSVVGFAGEDLVRETLKPRCHCWRYNEPVECPNNDKHDWRGDREKKLDYDIWVELKCAGCKYLHDGDAEVIQQRHEVKTNIAAYDESTARGGKIACTGNLYLELIQQPPEDLPKNQPKYYSEGWFLKYQKYGTIPAWVHFYQPYDAYEEILGRERKQHEPLFYQLATLELLDEWMKDPDVRTGDIFISKWPYELCVSITGEKLIRLIDEAKDKYLQPQPNKPWTDTKKWYWAKDKNGNLVNDGFYAHLVPIKDVAPFIDVNTGAYADIVEKARVTGVWEYYEKGENGQCERHKGCISWSRYNRCFVYGEPFVVAGMEQDEIPNELKEEARIMAARFKDNPFTHVYSRDGKEWYPDTDADKWMQLPIPRYLWFKSGVWVTRWDDGKYTLVKNPSEGK